MGVPLFTIKGSTLFRGYFFLFSIASSSVSISVARLSAAFVNADDAALPKKFLAAILPRFPDRRPPRLPAIRSDVPLFMKRRIHWRS